MFVRLLATVGVLALAGVLFALRLAFAPDEFDRDDHPWWRLALALVGAAWPVVLGVGVLTSTLALARIAWGP